MKFQLLLALACALTQLSTEVVIRSTGEQIVEVYFVADSKAFEIYSNEESTADAAIASMEADIDYFLTEVNKRFASMFQFINISIRKRKLDIYQLSSQGPTLTVQTPDLVAAHTALDAFTVWLSEQGARATLNYDLAMLWTGYNLYNTSTATAGYAYLGTVCDAQGTSVVEFDGTYSTVINTAHEIAHNLGASHDSGSTGYVMSATTSPSSTNRWDFSLCSASDVMGVVNQLTENCLTATSSVSIVSNGAITEKLSDPTALCQRKKGPSSTFCRDLYTPAPKGDDICKFLYCSDGGSMCSSVVSSDGLVCGTSKTCQEGTCQTDVTDAAAQAVTDENCIFGDTPTVTFNGFTGSCPAFLDQSTDIYCESSQVLKKCCKTCEERKDYTNPTCLYGDKSSLCSNYKPYQICGNSNNAATCCATCKGYTGRRRRDANEDASGSDAIVIFASPANLGGDIVHIVNTVEKEAEKTKIELSHVPLQEE